MGETTDHRGEFVLPKRVWLLFLLTLLIGPLVGYSCSYFFAAAANFGFDVSLFVQGAIFAHALGLVPAIMSVLLVWCVVISSQRWSVRLPLAVLSGFLATALYAMMLGSTLQDDITFILLAGAIGAVAQITCIVLWRRLGGG
ncbi:hypothetical protein AC244_15495 [Ensifer adhaerens]|uniref:Uncharacterized protein n=1 Tax=Ensifer adhaerens TaxID=106592 RepID=A0A0L8BT85_ENSAD|nr:hypothetical protein [Ensifer adhaerens]KOF17793.1 hypothetical protein AC244_15495 [Ensifer adhaerens]